jgi:hypothetical protein
VYLLADLAAPTTTAGAHKDISVLAITNAMARFILDVTLDGTGKAQIALASVADSGFKHIVVIVEKLSILLKRILSNIFYII